MENFEKELVLKIKHIADNNGYKIRKQGNLIEMWVTQAGIEDSIAVLRRYGSPINKLYIPEFRIITGYFKTGNNGRVLINHFGIIGASSRFVKKLTLKIYFHPSLVERYDSLLRSDWEQVSLDDRLTKILSNSCSYSGMIKKVGENKYIIKSSDVNSVECELNIGLLGTVPELNRYYYALRINRQMLNILEITQDGKYRKVGEIKLVK